MAKVLKFGLMLDDCNVRSLEGLQEHFVIEDVLKYFEDGTLSRWLKVWGYKEQLAAVEAIEKTLDKKDIVLQLANIFGIEDVDATDIEKALSVFSYLDKKQKFQVTVQENALFKKQAVEEYLAGYEAIIKDMIDNSGGDIATKLNNQIYKIEQLFEGMYESKYFDPDLSSIDTDSDIHINVDALKKDVQKLEQDYLKLTQSSFGELYFRLVGIAPMAIVAMLWSDTFRELLICKNANGNLYNNFMHTTFQRRVGWGSRRSLPAPINLLCNHSGYLDHGILDISYEYIFEKFLNAAFKERDYFQTYRDCERFEDIFYTIKKLRYIDALKTAFSYNNEFYTVEKSGNKVIVLAGCGFKGASDSGDFLGRGPVLCDGLVLKGKGSQVIYMGGSQSCEDG